MRSPKTVFVKQKEEKINFYLKDDRGNVYYLFTQAYNEPVIKYFGSGLAFSNLKNGLKKMPGVHIGKIIEKIYKQTRYVLKYEAV